MSPRRPWLSFERAGGLPPRDDEELAVSEDGRFTARRTIGGQSIGQFEGTLSSAAMGRLRKAVDSLAGADDLEIPTAGHGATEVLAAAGRALTSGSNETAPKPWRSLQQAVRRLLEDDVVEHPAAALRLIADARIARLEQAGKHELDVDPSTIQVSVVHMAADETVAGRWTIAGAGSARGWVTAGPGWSVELPFDHGLRLRRGDWLQVRVEVAIRAAGERRRARLYVPVLTDA